VIHQGPVVVELMKAILLLKSKKSALGDGDGICHLLKRQVQPLNLLDLLSVFPCVLF
jgi:hypothetical protein